MLAPSDIASSAYEFGPALDRVAFLELQSRLGRPLASAVHDTHVALERLDLADARGGSGGGRRD